MAFKSIINAIKDSCYSNNGKFAIVSRKGKQGGFILKIPYRGTGHAFIGEKNYKCDLYYSENNGGIALKINVFHDNPFGNYLEVPLDIKALFGQLDNGFKFTLLDLTRTGMEDRLLSGRTIYTYEAKLILTGVGGEDKKHISFHKVDYTLSNIVEWGELSAYRIGGDYELIKKIGDEQVTLYDSNDVKITYMVYGSFLPFTETSLFTEEIKLEQHGVIEIESQKDYEYEYFHNVFTKVKRLIEIASLRKVNVEKVNAYSREIVYEIQEKTIERAIEVYGTGIQDNEYKETKQGNHWKWICLSELTSNDSFKFFFEKYEKIVPIIELFLEPLYVNVTSYTKIFLNSVQALETYHSRFVTNDIKKFKLRVDRLVSNQSPEQAKHIRDFLMAKSKKFITLESRIADLLLADWQIYFDTGDLKRDKFPEIIAATRNYFIHYDERIKKGHRVLTEDELQIYNHVLSLMLEYYIMRELGFPVNSVEWKDKAIKRWGSISEELSIIKASKEKVNEGKVLKND